MKRDDYLACRKPNPRNSYFADDFFMVCPRKLYNFFDFCGWSVLFLIWSMLPCGCPELLCFGGDSALFVVGQSYMDCVSDIDCLDTVPLFLQTDHNYELKLERPSHEGDMIAPLEHVIELFPDFE